jgi:hypothetical protein
MKLNPLVALVVLGASTSLGLAAPAQADDPSLFGAYTFEGADGESATWTLTPCADDAGGCVQIAETGNATRRPWNGTATATVGSWVMFVGQPDAILCGDGGSAPGLNNYSWDAATLRGYASINTAGACGKGPESLAIPFTLTKTGSGPVQYPNAPVVAAPDVPAPPAPAPAEAPAAAAPAAPMPAESDPALVATPEVIAPAPFELTEAELAEPGFNR